MEYPPSEWNGKGSSQFRRVEERRARTFPGSPPHKLVGMLLHSERSGRWESEGSEKGVPAQNPVAPFPQLSMISDPGLCSDSVSTDSARPKTLWEPNGTAMIL